MNPKIEDSLSEISEISELSNDKSNRRKQSDD